MTDCPDNGGLVEYLLCLAIEPSEFVSLHAELKRDNLPSVAIVELLLDHRADPDRRPSNCTHSAWKLFGEAYGPHVKIKNTHDADRIAQIRQRLLSARRVARADDSADGASAESDVGRSESESDC